LIETHGKDPQATTAAVTALVREMRAALPRRAAA